MKTSKRILSVLLSVLMILSTVSCLGIEASAALTLTPFCDNTPVSRLNHFYSTGELNRKKQVIGEMLSNPNHSYDATPIEDTVDPNKFTGGDYSEGWYYLDRSTNLYVPCTGKHELAVEESLPDDSVFVIKNGVLVSYNGLGGAIVIPDSVTAIGDSAFANSYITSVKIPEGVTSIGSLAFSNCTKLTSVTLPNSLTSIGNNAFSDCSALTSIAIPDSVTSIGDSTFTSCSALTSITFPDTLTSLGFGTFYKCGSLTSVTIPAGVTSIDNNVFAMCTGLTELTISGNLTSIGGNAFIGCDIKTVNASCACDVDTLKAAFTDSGYEAENITFNQADHNFVDGTCSVCGEKEPSDFIIDENGVLIGYTGKGGDIVIPDGVTAIGTGAFKLNNKITSVIIPDGVTSIGENAFLCCNYLKSVEMPNVVSIGRHAFSSCTSLTSAEIPNAISIDKYAFYSCRSLTSVTLNTAVELLSSSFDGCNHIETVYYNCDGDVNALKSKMGNYAYVPNHNFVDGTCTECSMKEFVIDENGVLIGYNGKGGDIVIPDGVTAIGEKVFIGNNTITSVKIPESVTSIGNYAFMLCSELESITIPGNVKSVGYGAFMSCGKLANITIEDGVESFGARSFTDCTSLTSISFPDSVKSIGDDSFYYCLNLKDVTLPSGITSIGDSLFSSCPSLESIIIPDGVTSIGGSAFYGCRIKNITIPDSVETIGENAFTKCSALISITISDNTTGIASESFENCDKLENIYVTCGSDFRKAKKAFENAGYIDLNFEQIKHNFVDGVCTVCGFEKHTVTVNGGQLVSQKLVPEKSTEYEIATVTINEANGKDANGDWFVYWKDQDGNIVSSYSTYSFFVCEDRTLTPVYVSKSIYQSERAKAILVTDIVRADDNGDGTATLFAEHSASKAAVGDAINQHGIVYTTDAAQKDNLTYDNDDVNKTVAAKTATSLSGLFKAVIDVSENDTVYARSYIVDANGTATYGATKTLSVGAFSTSSFDSDFVMCGFDSAIEQADEVIATADEAPVVTETETETAPSFMSVLMSILNAVMALVQAIIALF